MTRRLGLLAFAATLLLCAGTIDGRQAAGASQVVLLGTGTPNADPDRSGPATAIIVGESAYVVDAGPGVVRRAAAASRDGIGALAPANLRRAFITHLHSDHTAGYPDLIFTPAVLERGAPFEVYGPPGLRRMTDHILQAYAEDIDIRINGLEPARPEGYIVNVHEVTGGAIYRDEHVKVTAFPVTHGSWKHALAYRFDTPDRSIVISGDCAPSESIVEHCDGCDVLVHEVYSTKGFATRPPEWQRYHAAFHTSTQELAELAARARPKLLVLYHQLFWGTSEDDLIREMRAAGYTGAVVSGDDLEVY